ncbi:hypothetical protein CCMA1212_000708 [Trichoderma ghanense]|uniref:Uncharacterized protein n=1 Tax=Trichoderma ghanense TaxID=65468 RepID=A0ABY2HJH7_9HYPO
MRARSNEACEAARLLWAGDDAGPEQSDDGDLGADAGSPLRGRCAPFPAGGNAIRVLLATAKRPSGGRARRPVVR